jgi:hypothetical protein
MFDYVNDTEGVMKFLLLEKFITCSLLVPAAMTATLQTVERTKCK